MFESITLALSTPEAGVLMFLGFLACVVWACAGMDF